MTKLAMAVACGALITLAACSSGHQPIKQTNNHWQQKVNQDLMICHKIIETLKVEPSEHNWFHCMHNLGSTL